MDGYLRRALTNPRRVGGVDLGGTTTALASRADGNSISVTHSLTPRSFFSRVDESLDLFISVDLADDGSGLGTRDVDVILVENQTGSPIYQAGTRVTQNNDRLEMLLHFSSTFLNSFAATHSSFTLTATNRTGATVQVSVQILATATEGHQHEA